MKSVDMAANEIRAEMLRRGVTLSELARQIGVSRQVVHQTINGSGTSRVRAAVAAVIEMPEERIWPSRFLFPRRGPGRPRKAA